MAEQVAWREIADTSPYDGEAFVCVNDKAAYSPEAREPILVYVPMLAYLVQRLGGIENITRMEDDGYDCGSQLMVKGTDRTVVSVTAVDRGPEEGLELIIEDWSNFIPQLSVHFRVPERWHTGEWFVAEVFDQDMIAATRSLRREVAARCNSFIGMSLADHSRGTYVR